jgi:hypothetical protein
MFATAWARPDAKKPLQAAPNGVGLDLPDGNEKKLVELSISSLPNDYLIAERSDNKP